MQEWKMSNIDSNLHEGMTQEVHDEGDKYKVTTKTCYTNAEVRKIVLYAD